MKKTALTLTLTLLGILFISSYVNIPGFVQVTKADSSTPPVYRVYSPKNNTVYSNDSLKFSFVIDPLVNCDCYYSLDERIELRNIRLEEISTIDPFRGPLPHVLYFTTELDDLSEGRHNLTIYHQYSNQFIPDWRTIVLDVTIIFYVDTVAPTITNLSVKSADSDHILLSYSINEEANWIGYSLDNQANVTVNGDAVLKDLSVGSHNVTIYAEDAHGHMGISETLTFFVEEPFPTTLVLAAASIITIAVFAGFLLMRKHKH
jgi:hypothetical protein